MSSRLTLLSKFIFDWTLAFCAALCLLPVGLGIALAIEAGSDGPVFFRQVRIGLKGKPFQIFKFRTMVPNDGKGAKVTVSGDARVTGIGAFLRKTKLDELPQLLNILCGDMSLIGPRPEVPDYVEKYSDQDRAIVLAVRPGLSDLASIRFRDESAILAAQRDPLAYYETKLLPAKLRYARFYVRHRNLCLDIKLMLWTLWAIAGWQPRAFKKMGHKVV